MHDIIVLILAAGDSSRLWPLGDKLFFQFLGKSLVEHCLTQLAKFGFQKFIVIGSEENLPRFSDLTNKLPRLDLTLVEQKIRSGIAGAILSASKYVIRNKILVVGPSDVFEDHLISQFQKIYQNNPEVVLVGKKLESYFPLGYLKITKGQVKGIVEKPPPDKLPSQIASLIFDYFQDGTLLLETLKKSQSDAENLYEQAKDRIINQGRQIELLSYNGYWGFLKYPWHVLDLSSYFLSQVKGNLPTPLKNKVNITGNVHIEEGVNILENVKIVGPAYIGRGTVIGQNCLIRESTIGEGNIIGFASEISRSYIANNCWFHHNFIGDSIVLDNCMFGYGACIANHRLDGQNIISQIGKQKIDSGRTKLGAVIGKNVRIGINSSIMPGIKIGRHSFVGSGVVLASDLPDNKFIQQKNTNFEVLDNRVKIDKQVMSKNRQNLRY